ncbi:MAG TPA: SIS domain-containing protein [Steroidobacteraceae bacterium]|nr:SIS domain-containing protein [Steroidobacteraceae bacterium]
MTTAAPKVIEGPYYRDLMSEPAALEKTLAWLRERGRWNDVSARLNGRRWKRIVLTGMGSSFHTLHPLNLALIAAGLNPVMMETSELIHYARPLCDADTLVVAVSQSGGSAEILKLLEIDAGSFVLGVTNSASGQLARKSDLTLLMQAGPEHSVSCKTYVAGMLILQWLSALLSGGGERETLHRLDPALGLVENYLRDWREHTDTLALRLHGVRHLFLAGRGGSLAAAGTGALIIKESARLHAEGMSSAAFRHGPMEMLNDQMWLGIFGGDVRTRELNLRLARELVARGAGCDIIDPESTCRPLRLPECSPQVLPILEILPMQMMTLALAGLSGREAGQFEHANKITDTE